MPMPVGETLEQNEERYVQSIMLISDLDILAIEILGDSITEITTDNPPNWFKYPAPEILSEIGESWLLEGKTLALKVPSCIITTSFNYILNCNHNDFNRIKILDHREFLFDPRLKA